MGMRNTDREGVDLEEIHDVFETSRDATCANGLVRDVILEARI
jgi:hypothetical protein